MFEGGNRLTHVSYQMASDYKPQSQLLIAAVIVLWNFLLCKLSSMNEETILIQNMLVLSISPYNNNLIVYCTVTVEDKLSQLQYSH